MHFYICLVDYKVTEKSFNFARKNHLPFYFVSASDGTNVVKVSINWSELLSNTTMCGQVFKEAIKAAVAYKEHSTDFLDDVMRELEVCYCLSFVYQFAI